MAEYQSLPELQKSRKLVYDLGDDAYEISISFLAPDVKYNDVKARMKFAYNSPAVLPTAKSDLDWFHRDTFMRTNDFTDPESVFRKRIGHIEKSCERLRPEYGSLCTDVVTCRAQ